MFASWKKSYDKPWKHVKNRAITLPTKVHIVKAMVFPVVMYGCESWTLKRARDQRIDGFKLWCWWRFFWVPWAARRSNQSIPKDINPEYSLEGLMLKLKLQYFGHLMGREDSFEKTLILGKIEGERRRGWQRMKWLDGITCVPHVHDGNSWTWVWVSSRSWWRTDKPGMLQSIGLQRVRHCWVTELNWTELKNDLKGKIFEK